MPDHPERDIEKQLRASAEQRRTEAGAPFELHNATRRSLQAEVARQYGHPTVRPAQGRSWWQALGPRLAIAAPVLVVLITGIFWVSGPRRTRDEALLASTKEKAAPESLNPVQPAAAPIASTSIPSKAEDKITPPDVMLAVNPRPDFKKDRETDAEPTEPDASLARSAAAVAVSNSPRPATLSSATIEVVSADSAVRAQEQLDRSTPLARTQTLADGGGFGGAVGGGGGFGGQGGGGGGFGGRAEAGAQSFADSTRRSTTDAVETDAFENRAQPQPTRQFAAGPTAASATAGRPEANQAARLDETPAAWLFRNSVAAAPRPRLEPRGGRGGGGAATRGAAGAAAPVLNSFRVEQSGNDLRVVDEDGSVYVGQILLTDGDALRSKEATNLRGQTVTRSRLGDAPTQSQILPGTAPAFFSVTGVNRSLSQQVIFTGQLQQAAFYFAPNGLVNGQQGMAGQSQKAEPSNVLLKQNQSGATSNNLPQQRVLGRAKLNDSREVPVDAFQIQP